MVTSLTDAAARWALPPRGCRHRCHVRSSVHKAPGIAAATLDLARVSPRWWGTNIAKAQRAPGAEVSAGMDFAQKDGARRSHSKANEFPSSVRRDILAMSLVKRTTNSNRTVADREHKFPAAYPDPVVYSETGKPPRSSHPRNPGIQSRIGHA